MILGKIASHTLTLLLMQMLLNNVEVKGEVANFFFKRVIDQSTGKFNYILCKLLKVNRKD